MRIAIGNDHVAVDMKNQISQHLREAGHDLVDLGTDSAERTDYPVYGHAVGQAVVDGRADRGIVICGTGVGISIAANKVPGVRCVCCSEPYSAQLSRQHNDTNVLAFGSRVVGIELAKMIVDCWMQGEFMGDRHAQRVAMLDHPETTPAPQSTEPGER